MGQAVIYSLPHIFKRGKVVEKAIGVKQSNCIIVHTIIQTDSIHRSIAALKFVCRSRALDGPDGLMNG